LPSDLIVLCRECHALYHGKLLPPQNEAQQSVQPTWGILPVSRHLSPPKRIPSPKGRRRPPHAANANR
jgi:hypothetical protein